jgi:hypothetical protein
MKNIKLLSVVLLTCTAAFCQTPAKVKLSGSYLAVQNGDSIALHFLSDHKLSAKIGHNKISNVDYKTAEVKQDIVITLMRPENGKKDSWVIKLLAMDDHEYQIKNIMHYFSDPDQPPESELLEGKIYILKKQTDH